MARIKKLTIPSVDEDAEQLEFSHNTGRNPNRNSHFGEQFDRFFFFLTKDYIFGDVLGSQTASFKVKHSYHMFQQSHS